MNFLPRENQILIKKQYVRKTFAFSEIIILFLMFANLILLFPSRLFLKISLENLERQIKTASQSSIFLRFSEIQASLEKFNSEITLLDKRESEVKNSTPALKKITDSKREGAGDKISIEFISFENDKKIPAEQPNKIIIQGKADNRAVLLKFIKTLEKEETFAQVQSPAANLLKEKDINYSLSIFLSR